MHLIKRFVAVCLFVIGLNWLMFASSAFAQGFEDVKDIQGLLHALIAGGAAVVASIVWERVKWFETLDTGLRMLVVGLSAIVLTTLSRVALQVIPEAWFEFANVYFRDWLPYLFSIAAVFGTNSVRRGLAKARTLVQLGKNPFSS